MKGQVQTMEPILIIIVLGILAVIGIVFFVRIGDTQIEIETDRIDELQAVEALKFISAMPELSCSKSVTTDTFCIDLYKAEAFSRQMDNDRVSIYYQPLFGTARITLETVDIFTESSSALILYDILSLESETRATSTHFTVYDPTTQQRKMAILTVQRES